MMMVEFHEDKQKKIFVMLSITVSSVTDIKAVHVLSLGYENGLTAHV